MLGAAALVAAEGVALAGFVAFFCYELATATATDTGAAVAETAFTAAGAVLLFALSRSLSRVRRWARTPVVVLQIVFLPVGYSLAFQAEQAYAGLPVLVAALVTLYLLMTPTARLAFEDRG